MRKDDLFHSETQFENTDGGWRCIIKSIYVNISWATLSHVYNEN